MANLNPDQKQLRIESYGHAAAVCADVRDVAEMLQAIAVLERHRIIDDWEKKAPKLGVNFYKLELLETLVRNSNDVLAFLRAIDETCRI